MTYAEFKSLALAYMEELNAFAMRLTRSRPDAEDLLHNTYARAFAKWRELREPAAVRAWLFQILRGIFINERRRAARSPVLELVTAENMHTPAQGNRPLLEDQILDRLLSAEVEEALDRLPDTGREIVMLADIWGFTYAEIAEILACPVGTVRSRLHRARAKLAAELAAYAHRHGYGEDAHREPKEGNHEWL